MQLPILLSGMKIGHPKIHLGRTSMRIVDMCMDLETKAAVNFTYFLDVVNALRRQKKPRRGFLVFLLPKIGAKFASLVGMVTKTPTSMFERRCNFVRTMPFDSFFIAGLSQLSKAILHQVNKVLFL